MNYINQPDSHPWLTTSIIVGLSSALLDSIEDSSNFALSGKSLGKIIFLFLILLKI